jgi:hypothetical protein
MWTLVVPYGAGQFERVATPLSSTDQKVGGSNPSERADTSERANESPGRPPDSGLPGRRLHSGIPSVTPPDELT